MTSYSIYNDSPEEILASGPVFFNTGKTLLGRKIWNLRKIEFSGIHIYNYDNKGTRKGKWNILDCEVKSFTAEEVGSPDAKFAFGLCSKNRTYLFCAVNENDKLQWMTLLSDQILQRKDILHRYLLVQEHIIAISIVSRKSGYSFLNKWRPTSTSSVVTLLMIMTDASRILLIDTMTAELVDQMVWDPRCPPNTTFISEYVIKLQLEKQVFIINLRDDRVADSLVTSVNNNNEEENNDKSRNTMDSILDDEDIPHKPTTASEWIDLIADLPQTKVTTVSNIPHPSASVSGKLGSVLEGVLSQEYW